MPGTGGWGGCNKICLSRQSAIVAQGVKGREEVALSCRVSGEGLQWWGAADHSVRPVTMSRR
jgi:hypothetical protein